MLMVIVQILLVKYAYVFIYVSCAHDLKIPICLILYCHTPLQSGFFIKIHKVIVIYLCVARFAPRRKLVCQLLASDELILYCSVL